MPDGKPTIETIEKSAPIGLRPSKSFGSLRQSSFNLVHYKAQAANEFRSKHFAKDSWVFQSLYPQIYEDRSRDIFLEFLSRKKLLTRIFFFNVMKKGIDPIRAFVSMLSNAAGRYHDIRTALSPHFVNPSPNFKGFPINITRQKKF